MKRLAGITCAVALVFAANVAIITPAHAETSTSDNIATLMETLKSLMAKVADLQSQLTKVRGEVQETNSELKDVIKSGLKEGMSNEDVTKIQDLLATDKELYPEGLVTGYYGKLTKEAVKRFQVRHKLSVNGEIDEDTHDLLEEYFKERFDNKVPQGLMRAPGILKKVQDRICDSSRFIARGLFCKDWSGSDEKDEDDEEIDYEVDVEVEDGETVVSFELDGKDYTVTVESTDLDEILEAIADELDEDIDDVDEAFVDEIEEKLESILEDDEVDEDDAQDALDDADEAIADVQEAIDEADNDVDTDDAQDALDDAEELLKDAQDAFDDEDFEAAEELASDAIAKAEEAEELLEEAIEDAQ